MKNLLLPLILLTSISAFAQPAGSLDPTFNNTGQVVTSITTGNDQAHSVAIQTDGKIVVGGHSTSSITNRDFTLVRYKTDGLLDSTFGTNGIVTTDIELGSDDVGYSVAIQLDGKIILGGFRDDGNDKDAVLVRYETDGSIDTTFGVNGIVLTDFDNDQHDEIKVVKIHQITGDIVVGGSSLVTSSTAKPVVARYLSDGALDTTFNSTGIRLLWITSLDFQYLFSVEDLEVQSNGKISAVGWRDFTALSWDSDYWACRISTNGSMDNTFSSDGVNVYNGTFNGHDQAYAMLLKSDNSILMAGGGHISTLRYDFSLFGLNVNGGVGTFSASADWGSTLDDIAYSLEEDNNGKYVLGGISGHSASTSFALTRINVSGTTDASFGNGGKVSTSFGTTFNGCFDIAIQTDNKIVAVGYAGDDFAVARYLGDAVPDLDNFNLISPAHLSINQNFASLPFDWSDAFGATSYEIDIDTIATFNGSPQTFTIANSNYIAPNLLHSTEYFWRVRARAGTSWGAYSVTRSFTTNSLENFNLISPADGAIDQEFISAVFDWSDNIGAANYQIEFDTTQAFSASSETATVPNSNYTSTLLSTKTYYWHVRVSDGTNFGPWTGIWEFTTKENPNSSISELPFSDLKIYPNPTSDLVTIESNSLLLNAPYKLLDNLGREVFSGWIDSEKITLQLKALPAGNYFLNIGSTTQRTFKILKD